MGRARYTTSCDSYESRTRSTYTVPALQFSAQNCLLRGIPWRCRLIFLYRPYLDGADINFSEMRDGQSKSISMLECTDLVLQSLEAMDTRMAALVGETLPTQPAPTNLEVPQPVEDLLLTLTTARFESHTNIPVDQGIDEVIFYLDRATQWQARKQTSQQSQASKWANLLTAYWLLRATKASKEYQTAVTTPSVANFEQQFPRLGMTVQRFFSKLEQVGGRSCVAGWGDVLTE